MRLERYSVEIHQEFLNLLSARGMSTTLARELPAYGVMAFECDTPVCAGFLRSVEGGFGMIDGLITNPEMTAGLRHEALNTVVGNLIEAAKEFGMSLLMAFTLDDSVRGRASEFKFEELPHTLIKLNLTGDK